jgi:hypothetical protein
VSLAQSAHRRTDQSAKGCACDPDAWLRPAANTAEFANFSGDRSPTCEFMNMVLLLLKGESWIASMYLDVTFSTKI